MSTEREQLMDGWVNVADRLPDEGVTVETVIRDSNGTRNEAQLKRSGALWFFEDGSMYVYYTPTHWKAVSGR